MAFNNDGREKNADTVDGCEMSPHLLELTKKKHSSEILKYVSNIRKVRQVFPQGKFKKGTEAWKQVKKAKKEAKEEIANSSRKFIDGDLEDSTTEFLFNENDKEPDKKSRKRKRHQNQNSETESEENFAGENHEIGAGPLSTDSLIDAPVNEISEFTDEEEHLGEAT